MLQHEPGDVGTRIAIRPSGISAGLDYVQQDPGTKVQIHKRPLALVRWQSGRLGSMGQANTRAQSPSLD